MNAARPDKKPSAAPDVEPEVVELLDEIRSLTVGREWRITLDQVLSILQLDRAEYYRRLYASPSVFPERCDVELFTGENTKQLMFLLEDCVNPRAVDLFISAGYFFSQDILFDWDDFFISVTLSRLQNHSVDRELLETALAGCLRFDDAAEFYCSARFHPDEFIQFAALLFLKRKRIEVHSFSLHLLEEHLRERLKLRIIRWSDLCRSLNGSLWRLALRLNLLTEIQFGATTDYKPSAETRAALRQLGLPTDRRPRKSELQRTFRKMIKQVHPDRNPDTAERARSLIESYTHLLGEIDSGGCPDCSDKSPC